MVLTSLLYGCETWTLYRKQIKQLEVLHMRSLRRIMDIRWQDKVTNLQVLDIANAVSIEALLFKAQLRWTGHVIRMDYSGMPRQILHGELVRGTRKKGHPKKWYKECVKETLKQCSLSPQDQETSAQDRPGWHATSRPAPSLRTTAGTNSQMPEHVERHQQQHQMKQHSSTLTVPDYAFQEEIE